MSDSYRIQVNEVDRSQTVQPNAGTTGAMVLTDAISGPSKPMFFSRGETNRLNDIFGYEKVGHTQVWEAKQFLNQASMWVSAPYDPTSTNSGAFASSTGFTKISDGEDPGVGTGDVEPSFQDTTQYFAVFEKYPSTENRLRVAFTYDDSGSENLWTLEVQLKRGRSWEIVGEYTFTLYDGVTGDMGRSLYYEDVLADNPYIVLFANPDVGHALGEEDPTAGTPVTMSFPDDGSNAITLDGGSRVVPTDTEVAAAWQQFQSFRKYPFAIAMDASTNESVPAEFDTLRNSYQKYASYILPLPPGEDASTAIDTRQNGVYSGISNRGISIYWNHGKVKSGSQVFWTPLTGRVGVKFAQMVNVFNGLAPSWIDENNHGGQLGAGIMDLEFDPSEDFLEQMDKATINPIILDPVNGPMIVSQRTSVTGNLSDDSWIAHSRLFDYIIKNIKEQVLVTQITKLNDDIHRRLATSKGQTIIQPIVEANLLNDAKIKCDLSNNDANARSQRQFVFSLAVQVTPFSEYIVFNFVKAGQGVSVSSVLD